MNNVDLIVIGAGPAGYLAAERMAEAGKKVVMIEKAAVGGVCLNEGCIPSKALLNSAKIYAYMTGKGEPFGVRCDHARLDHAAVLERKNWVVSQLVGGIGAKMRKLKVEIVSACAQIKGKGDNGFIVAAGGNEYTGANLLLATGSVPVIPPIEGVAQGISAGWVLTNRELLDIESIPGKLAIIGGGVIGLEMAAYFSAAGSQVTVIEMLGKVGGSMDSDITNVLQADLEQHGVKFHLESRVTKLVGGQIYFTNTKEKQSAAFDKVLLCVGRKPFSAVEGIEKLGVNTERDAVLTDERCETNVAGVYAAGDVNGKSMLAHTGYREAEVAVNNILGKKDIMDYSAIPGIIYTQPEAASVGMDEQTARRSSLDISVKKISMNYSGRYMAENASGKGLCKVIIDNKRGVIVGVHMIGSYASEIIYSAVLMVQNKIPVDSIKKTVFPHPTVSEIIREALFN